MLINKFEKFVTLFGVALSDKEQILDLRPSAMGNLGSTMASPGSSSSLINNSPNNDEQKYVTFSPGIQLDKMSQYLPRGRPVVLKVDVEGAECDALSEGLDYLSSLSIEYVSIEWSYKRLQTCKNREALFDLFLNNGLKPFLHVSASGDEVNFEMLDHKNIEGWKQRGNFPNVGLYDIVWSKENPKTYVLP